MSGCNCCSHLFRMCFIVNMNFRGRFQMLWISRIHVIRFKDKPKTLCQGNRFSARACSYSLATYINTCSSRLPASQLGVCCVNWGARESHHLARLSITLRCPGIAGAAPGSCGVANTSRFHSPRRGSHPLGSPATQQSGTISERSRLSEYSLIRYSRIRWPFCSGVSIRWPFYSRILTILQTTRLGMSFFRKF